MNVLKSSDTHIERKQSTRKEKSEVGKKDEDDAGEEMFYSFLTSGVGAFGGMLLSVRYEIF